jgi:hypothetical protein
LLEYQINRNNHLIILDNTETLIFSDDDVKELGNSIKSISRRLGRVIVTSRRREKIESNQIELQALSTTESINLMKSKSKELNISQINSSNDQKLGDFSDRLGNKPIVLEVFLQKLSNSNINLQSAFEIVQNMQRQDLGEFLYSDAWDRLSDDIKHLLLLMANISDLHDDYSLKLCCQYAKITIIKAQEALEESRGIASIYNLNGVLQISLNQEFRRFCENRRITLNGVQLPTLSSIVETKKRYNEFIKTRSIEIRDRIGRAYRHVLAKSAWKANNEGDYIKAKKLYEEAVLADSQNGWLFDRYAYFLFSRREYPLGLIQAKKAVEITSQKE